MEDAHSFVADFAGVRGQGYFAVFDGHAGKHAAEWCGEHFHEELIEALYSFPRGSITSQPNGNESNGNGGGNGGGGRTTSVPDVLNRTFHAVDENLSRMADEGQTHSGCTAVTAFLRLEDDDGNQPSEFVEAARAWQVSAPPNPLGASAPSRDGDSSAGSGGGKEKSGFNTKVKSAVRSITGKSPSSEPEEEDLDSATSPASAQSPTTSATTATPHISAAPSNSSANQSTNPVTIFPGATRRVLYTANAGDARAVLSRGGRAVRLTYDHKGSDAQEAKRIKEAGGFVMNNRVNGASFFSLLPFFFFLLLRDCGASCSIEDLIYFLFLFL